MVQSITAPLVTMYVRNEVSVGLGHPAQHSCDDEIGEIYAPVVLPDPSSIIVIV